MIRYLHQLIITSSNYSIRIGRAVSIIKSKLNQDHFRHAIYAAERVEWVKPSDIINIHLMTLESRLNSKLGLTTRFFRMILLKVLSGLLRG